MTPEMIVQYIVYLPICLVLFGLIFAICIDSYLGERNRSLMLLIVLLTVCVVLVDGVEYLLKETIINPRVRTWNSIAGYCVRPVIVLLFLHIVGPHRRMWPLWVLIGVNALIHMTALFSSVCFAFADNHFIRGPLGYTSHIVSGVLLAILLFRTIREYHRSMRAEMWLPICSTLMIVAAVVLDSVIYRGIDIPVSFLTIAVVCCTLFYYIWLHLQFVRRHEDDLMASQRIRIMMTQIQPHFLYNTIATFKALCKKDPDRAAEVADKFGAYLRRNLDTLDTTGLIPFDRELEHTQLYADIEMVRFENVRVEYEIEDRGFFVPPLTLQPMVENAIRHGVRSREKGIVRVHTFREAGNHVITVEDNGVGFDVNSMTDSPGSHIGVRNVRERIESMCGGSLSLESKIGEGTTVILRIPEGEELK